MFFLENISEDIYYNLAAEEYLLKRFSGEFCMLWTGPPCVVAGKHQNILAELNLEFIHSHNVIVARRMTGGGTVYHDTGNLNFTFIRNGREGALIDFRGHTQIIRDYLLKLGLEIKIEGHHSLTLHGLKISGNAEHVFKKRVLHHGTLLFAANLKHLEEALNVKNSKYFHKAVHSIPSNVTNIEKHLTPSMTLKQFANGLINYIWEQETGIQRYRLTHQDHNAILDLRDTKYATPDWIYGYSPKYAFKNNRSFNDDHIYVEMDVDRGLVRDIRISGDALDTSILHAIETQCRNALHTPDTFKKILERTNRLHPGNGLDDPDLIYAFF